jgi:GMP synthase (glutamine-hydrolysing)
VTPAPESAGRVLIVTHVPWEGPHRIAGALLAAGLTLDHRCVLDGDELPAAGELAGAVFMGGPMNVDQLGVHPGLLLEREWIADAAAKGLPLLGVCLGAQLLARALGGAVVPGLAPEIGWAPVEISGADDPLLRHLAPSSQVLHWHSDVIALPDGARALASSAQTELQAFRKHNAWGLLFHAEADHVLANRWLAEPRMRSEAEAALGQAGADAIVTRAKELERELTRASDPLFAEFARIAAGG